MLHKINTNEFYKTIMSINLNTVHIGPAENLIERIEEEITLTITSPPYYDDNIYILDDGSAEFGWFSYEEYINSINIVIEKIYSKTENGGKLVLILANTPKKDKEGNIQGLYPIVHDIIKSCLNMGWYLFDEAVWYKKYPSYGLYNTDVPPNMHLIQQHDWISVLGKGYKKNHSKPITLSSVWKLPNDAGYKYQEYNQTYGSFPKKLLQNCIKLWSNENDIILDPFAGSGQVIREAINLKRRAIGFEIDPQWAHLWSDFEK